MSVSTFEPTAEVVTMTEAAVRHFRTKLAGQAGKIIRLSTQTSGCTGYAYVLDFADGPEAGDTVIHPAEGITVAVDTQALKLLRGTEIDMATEGVNRVIKFNNPNVVAECGCGESFNVE
ncbi:MAG: iron-sulfur cluster assembly accessory protein [Gammaproteobacteria bacterium]|uniref:HesB/IscA family protein n=1 Tax=Pseudomaricurvus alcaniphilus TaxID=1166482 RepID=UPI00140BA5A7|nr:iron-sulfur cluster assembly accessory protein [Pseudomaricurvus alcaniphilus]MBR9911198.1 iron-sulfur cluster assembly accessory protein [Gammaproteobacteria bacterium]NHN37577.1 iron-sulfur cluster assembly accessory protein [Pseudomaricurvus alcaniphilus]